MYYNTTNLPEADLSRAQNSAAKQDQRILDFFKTYGSGAYSPSFVWNITGMKQEDIPLTSVRRSITTLTNQKKLMMTEHKEIGPYGKPEHFWMLAPETMTKLF